MSSLYSEIIQDAYKYPAHRGEVEGFTHVFEDENPLCGDMLRVELRVEDGRIVEAGYQGRGCAISQASAELICDMLTGLPVERAGELNRDIVLAEMGIPSISPARLKCALLSVEVIKQALAVDSSGSDEGSHSSVQER